MMTLRRERVRPLVLCPLNARLGVESGPSLDLNERLLFMSE
jgi:hypothetical protein